MTSDQDTKKSSCPAPTSRERSTRKPNGYWTKERCHEDAKNHNIKVDWKNSNSSAYSIADRNGWLDEVCGHMVIHCKPVGHWTKENCHEVAKACESRGEFSVLYGSAYKIAQRNRWLDDICGHMYQEISINVKKIYAIEFDDNSVYVGLSCNPEKRHSQHVNDPQNSGLIEKIGVIPHQFKVLDGDYPMNKSDAAECAAIADYEKRGFTLLNIAPGGGTGGNFRKHTPEKVKAEVLKYATKKAFREGSPHEYDAADRLGIMDEVCAHMTQNAKSKTWTPAEIHDVAKTYDHRNDFCKGEPSACRAARKLGLMEEVCAHMTPAHPPWTLDTLQAVAKPYASRSDFKRGYGSAYNAARRLGILDEVCAHMTQPTVRNKVKV